MSASSAIGHDRVRRPPAQRDMRALESELRAAVGGRVDFGRGARALCGVDAHRLDSGCCGLAGNFGFERGHHEVSIACAERVMAPAFCRADPDALVVADGFSCRTQIQHTTGRRALHLTEVLDAGLAGSDEPPGESEGRDDG